MSRNSLAMYNVYVKRTRGDRGYAGLNDINGVDFYSIIEGFCTALKNKGLQSDDTIKRSFSVDRMVADPNGRWIYGRLFKGDYGTQRDVYNAITGEKSKELEEDEVVPEPFYFGFYLPLNHFRGFLLLQRVGAVGVLGDFQREMKSNIDKTVIPGHYFKILGAVSGRVIDELYRNGRISKLTFVRYAANSRDMFDGVAPMEVEAQLLIKAPRRRALPLNEQFRRTRERGRRVSDIVALTGIDFPYDKVTAEIHGLGKKWTVDLSNYENMLPYYILEDMPLDTPVYPALEAVHEFAKDLVNAHITGEMGR